MGRTKSMTMLGAKQKPSSNWEKIQAELKEEAAKKAAARPASGTPYPFRKKKRRAEEKAAEAGPSTSQAEEVSADARGPVGLDCEYVGVGREGTEDMLARVSLVDGSGAVLLDAYVRPTEKITDFRTEFSGIRPSLVTQASARTFPDVQAEVAKLIDGRLVVGHALYNDFKVLRLSHPGALTRDTARYAPFQEAAGGMRNPSLKGVAKAILGLTVQRGEHNSVKDAQVAMQLYQLHRRNWEAAVKARKRFPHGKPKAQLKRLGKAQGPVSTTSAKPLPNFPSAWAKSKRRRSLNFP